jgi:hypothetical protein
LTYTSKVGEPAVTTRTPGWHGLTGAGADWPALAWRAPWRGWAFLWDQ